MHRFRILITSAKFENWFFAARNNYSQTIKACFIFPTNLMSISLLLWR